jgi:hypothetical protein
MSKYEPLTHFLQSSNEAVIELTFAEMERIIGEKLPASAYKHRALWSNNTVGHVMTQAWVAAGYLSESVDMARKRVTFRRTDERSAPKEGAKELKALGEERWKKLFGCMRGTVTIPEGVDIMEPVELEWDAMKD